MENSLPEIFVLIHAGRPAAIPSMSADVSD